jgi:hypothetical protein
LFIPAQPVKKVAARIRKEDMPFFIKNLDVLVGAKSGREEKISGKRIVLFDNPDRHAGQEEKYTATY